ncbi:hypothetical protein JOQ06_004466 [Pogonophryne albipinna]|uniref:Uncharacterized protein n=1 Tax=Pogonophryne albipinna TaxID=1090488 RepID=A0AAD6FCN5_9TELE|nr:hypothetical protein JOQ06_004466 [Pogonophryne albipinna]
MLETRYKDTQAPTRPFFKPTSSASPTHYKPTYHIARAQKKVQDWSLSGTKPILILGDSNINRIPPHNNPNIQLDSYPGVYNLMELFTCTPPISTAKIVIISNGINNKDDEPGLTTIEQLRSMEAFRTTHDNIHWTPPTAKLILDSWYKQLHF